MQFEWLNLKIINKMTKNPVPMAKTNTYKTGSESVHFQWKNLEIYKTGSQSVHLQWKNLKIYKTR